jgi:hypothetical protein
MAKKSTFKTKLLLAGKTATGFNIPPEIVEGLGAGKKPPVNVTINGYTYRNTVAVYRGEFMLGVSAEHRAGAKVKAGDILEVTLELDTKPRMVEIPPDFKRALAKKATAKKTFEALSYSGKQGYILPINAAKTDETRLRRIEKAIDELSMP